MDNTILVLYYEIAQGEWGHYSLIINGPQSFITTLTYLLAKKLWVLLSNLDWFVQTFHNLQNS